MLPNFIERKLRGDPMFEGIPRWWVVDYVLYSDMKC